MTTTTNAMEPISDEQLEEMLAGLEGVTPGPYATSRHENRPRDGASYESGAPDRGVAGMLYAKDAAHFKRCDPGTIRSLITELQSCRSKALSCIESGSPIGGEAEPVALDPDMPASEMRLHMGEMSAQEMRTARAAIRWANSAVSPKQGEAK